VFNDLDVNNSIEGAVPAGNRVEVAGYINLSVPPLPFGSDIERDDARIGKQLLVLAVSRSRIQHTSLRLDLVRYCEQKSFNAIAVEPGLSRKSHRFIGRFLTQGLESIPAHDSGAPAGKNIPRRQ
jgi:hypothetical protein